jgi:hypothetical protein
VRRRSRIEALVAFFRPAHGGSASLLLSRERFTAAQTLIAAYYAVLFFFAAGELFSWQGYRDAGDLTPRWPVFWLRFVDPGAGIAAILWLHLLGGLLAVTLSRYRWARIVVFVSLLEHMALKFSFGAVNHGDHLGVLIAFVLIFLPAGWHVRGGAGRTVRAATLLVFSGAQALILLTYSMAGMWKAGGILQQWIQGELVTYLHPQGLARQIAAKMIEDDAPSLLGPWLVEHPWVGWDRGDLPGALRPLGGRPPLSAPSLGVGSRPLPSRHASGSGRRLSPEHPLAGPVPDALALSAGCAGLAPGGRRSSAPRGLAAPIRPHWHRFRTRVRMRRRR